MTQNTLVTTKPHLVKIFWFFYPDFHFNFEKMSHADRVKVELWFFNEFKTAKERCYMGSWSLDDKLEKQHMLRKKFNQLKNDKLKSWLKF